MTGGSWGNPCWTWSAQIHSPFLGLLAVQSIGQQPSSVAMTVTISSITKEEMRGSIDSFRKMERAGGDALWPAASMAHTQRTTDNVWTRAVVVRWFCDQAANCPNLIVRSWR